MPLRAQADDGVPLVIVDPDDPAAQAIRQIARGLIAMSPVQLPVLPLVEVSPTASEPPASPKPVGMSLPMA
jgi:ATP-binding protein involved in chromosome partitioning